MNRILSFVLLFAVTCSCADSRLTPAQSKEDVFHMSVNAGDPTKTVINEITPGEEYGVYWQSGDAIGVYEVSAEGIAAEKTISDPLEDGGASALFALTFTGTPTAPFNYCFVYPETALSKDGSVKVTIPSTQYFRDGSYDPKADVLVSEPVSAQSRPEEVNVRFARLGATVKMLVKAPTTTETLRRITFSTTQSSIVGSYELNPSTGELGALSGSNSIVLVPEASTTYSGNFDVWFRMAQATLSEDFTVKIETDTKTYTKTVNLASAEKTLEFLNGRLSTITVNMTAVVGVDSWDNIDVTFTEISGNAYASWGPKKGSYSQAYYSGNNCKDGNYFRMRTDGSNTGVVTTTSGGYVQAVTVNLPVDASAPRTIDIYASNTAYNSPSELFGATPKGTKIGSVTASTAEAVSKTIWLADSYQYVAFRSNSNSTLVESIKIKWEAYPPYTQSGGTSYDVAGLLEMPSYTVEDMAGTTTSELNDLYLVTHSALMGGKVQRNYTLLYDPAMYASYWVAYPICSDHLTTGRKDSWAFDPDVPTSKQTRLDLGAYGVNYSGTYDKNYYARGHQIPNADRNNVAEMQAQTYYSTNITPQLQNGFNGGTWANLEAAVRGAVPAGDTLYVVTGAAFRKKGAATPETITFITNKHDNKDLPVPNYYWKALLKVKRNSSGEVTGACAIGFWLPHNDSYATDGWKNSNVSVDQIEQWTGFNLFANLSTELQTSAETNTNWSTFTSF